VGIVLIENDSTFHTFKIPIWLLKFTQWTYHVFASNAFGSLFPFNAAGNNPLIHHQGIICGVAFDRSSLRRIAPYASVVAPRRLASNTLLVIRNTP